MFNVDITIFGAVFVISVVILSSFLGIIIASYAVTTGADILGIKLSLAIRKAVVFISALSAGYLGVTWVLAHW